MDDHAKRFPTRAFFQPVQPDAPTEVKQGRSIDRVFVDAVKSGDGSEILSPYSDAIKSLAISLAANRSGKSGKLESV